MADLPAGVDPSFMGDWFDRESRAEDRHGYSLTPFDENMVFLRDKDNDAGIYLSPTADKGILVSQRDAERRYVAVLDVEDTSRARTLQLFVSRIRARDTRKRPVVEWRALANGGLGPKPTRVYAMTEAVDDLYVGGTFTETADGTLKTLGRIARYSDGKWYPLANGGLNGTVKALASAGDYLYVGGEFSGTADGAITGLKNIARYSFSTGAWSPLPNGGLDGPVTALAPSGEDDRILVGGAFTGTPDKAVAGLRCIAAYSPKTAAWSGLANGGLDGSVSAITVAQGSAYVGGNFLGTADGTVTGLSYIAEYEEGKWSALAAGGPSREVTSLAVSNYNSVFVGGQFADRGRKLNFVARYSPDATWNPLPHGGLTGSVFALEAVGDDIYVGGGFVGASDGKFSPLTDPDVAGGKATGIVNVAKLAGDEWSPLPDGGLNHDVPYDPSFDGDTPPTVKAPAGNVYALAVKGADLYAGGYFDGTYQTAVTDLNGIAVLRNVVDL